VVGKGEGAISGEGLGNGLGEGNAIGDGIARGEGDGKSIGSGIVKSASGILIGSGIERSARVVADDENISAIVSTQTSNTFLNFLIIFIKLVFCIKYSVLCILL